MLADVGHEDPVAEAGERLLVGLGGGGAFFLLLDEPEVYGLPPDPVVTTRDLPGMWKHVAIAAAGLAGTAIALGLGRRR